MSNLGLICKGRSNRESTHYLTGASLSAPKLIRTGLTFESFWANHIKNILICQLFGHVLGSFWYFFGLEVSKNDIWNFIFTTYKISCFCLNSHHACKRTSNASAQNERKKQKRVLINSLECFWCILLLLRFLRSHTL